MSEIEKAFLGAILSDSSATWVIDKAKPDYFTNPKLRKLYEFMVELLTDGQPLDLVVHLEDLQKRSLTTAWRECIESPGSAALVGIYLGQLRKGYAERAINGILARQGLHLSDEDRELIKDLLDDTERTSMFSAIHPGDRMTAVMQEMEDRAGKPPELPFGIPGLDDLLWGAHAGELLTIGAYTGVGKTTVMTNFAWNMARAGHRILYFSTEMTANEFIRLRLLPLASGVDSWIIRRNRVSPTDRTNWVKVAAGSGLIAKTPFLLNDLSSPSLGDIRYAIRHEKPKAVFVDYINRCRMPKGESRALQVYAFVQGLKGIARDENLPVIAAAQLNRVSQEEKAPSVYHLRESGGIEIESDSIILLHQVEPGSSSLELIIGKNRHGEQATLSVYRDSSTLAIKPFAPGSEAAA